MVQIPDNIRPALAAVVKHHFWLLLGVVPVVVLPPVFLARGKLDAEMDTVRRQIDGRLADMKSVAGIQPHPNDAWSGEIAKATRKVKRETLAEWEKFWRSQEPLRTWPASLGPDFHQRVAALTPGGKLPRPLLLRYQNGVPAIVRALPERMGAEAAMAEGETGGPAQPMPTIPPRKGVGKKPTRPVQWSPADQARLYASFKWDRPPSTAQVLLAQEELWVYGLLADAIARVNKAAGAADDAAIPLVEELAVGYPAAEDHPGGAAGGRIVMPAAVPQSNLPGDFGPLPSQGPPSQGPPSQGMDAAGGAVVRPPHPRFSGGFGPPMPGAGGPTPPDAPTAADDQLRNWIYVGFSGKPLLAAELGTAPDSMLLHLVPFVLRAVVDERKLDALLVDLATTSVPIDVRQVRINPGGGGSAVPGGRDFAPGMPGGAAASPRSRPNDVVVELRGTVALATPPDRRLLGLENEANASDDAGGGDDPLESSEQAEPEPAAADGGGDRP